MISESPQGNSTYVYNFNSFPYCTIGKRHGPSTILMTGASYYAAEGIVGPKGEEDTFDIRQAADEKEIPYFGLYRNERNYVSGEALFLIAAALTHNPNQQSIIAQIDQLSVQGEHSHGQ